MVNILSLFLFYCWFSITTTTITHHGHPIPIAEGGGHHPQKPLPQPFLPQQFEEQNVHFHQRKDKIPILHNHNLASMELLQKGLQFLDSVQNPINCTGHRYMITNIGIPGGFASQFQLAASIWMRLLAETDFMMPILLQGKLVGYSEGKECESYQYSWNCYFLSSSRCEKELLTTGQLVTQTSKSVSNEESIPPTFKPAGFFQWWGIIQSYLFRFQPYVESYILSVTHKMSNMRMFPYGLPMIGIHVRHGDKHVDQWKEYSLAEELQTITDSIDCQITGNYSQSINTTASSTDKTPSSGNSILQKFCFYKLNLSEEYSTLVLFRALHNQTILLRKQDIPHFMDIYQQQRQSELYSLLSKVKIVAKDIASWKKHYISVLSSSTSHSTTNSSSHAHSSRSEAAYYHHHHLDPFQYYKIHEYNITSLKTDHPTLEQYYPPQSEYPFKSHQPADKLAQIHNNNTNHQHESDVVPISEKDWKNLIHSLFEEEYVIPVDFFIASDDLSVVQAAKERQFFVNKEGISQQTHGNAMISIVLKHHDTSFEASLQIFTDIFLLSQCSTLIGAAASQVFRMAVAMSKVKGFLHYAKAIDAHMMRKIQQMSRKYNLPCPEEFSS